MLNTNQANLPRRRTTSFRLIQIIWIRPINLNPSSLRGPHTSPIPSNYLQQNNQAPIISLNPAENSSSIHKARPFISTPHPIHPSLAILGERKFGTHWALIESCPYVCTTLYISIDNGFLSSQFRGCWC